MMARPSECLKLGESAKLCSVQARQCIEICAEGVKNKYHAATKLRSGGKYDDGLRLLVVLTAERYPGRWSFPDKILARLWGVKGKWWLCTR